jgi:hypothetical protein
MQKSDGRLKRQFVQLSSMNRDGGSSVKTGLGRLYSKYDLWYKFVEAYTKLNITYDSDLLPALAGLAKNFNDIDDLRSNYVAGIWEEDLPRGLLWRRTPLPEAAAAVKPTQPYPDKIPTWSWVSGKSDLFGITFSIINMDDTFTIDSRLELLGIERSGSCDQARFLGSETSSIRLRGALSPAKVCSRQVVRKDISSNNNNTVDILLENNKSIRCDPDFEYFDPPKAQQRTLDITSTVYCLALGLRTFGYMPQSKVGDKGIVGYPVGLLLRLSSSKGGNCYERIGQLEGEGGATDFVGKHGLKPWGGATEEVIELVLV